MDAKITKQILKKGFNMVYVYTKIYGATNRTEVFIGKFNLKLIKVCKTDLNIN